MSFLGDLLWIFLGGIIIFFFYLLGGFMLCLTIVGIPFGLQLFKLAALSLAPFGKEVDTEQSAGGLLSICMNVLWWVFGGVEVAVMHLVLALFFTITIIGIPFAKQHIKLLKLALVPFGARLN